MSGSRTSPRRPDRSPRHRPLDWLAAGLILVGLALGTDVVVTLAWQEPVTAVIAAVRRSGVNERWVRGTALNRADRAQLAALHGTNARIAYLAREEAARAPDGAALGTLRIPRMQLSTQLIQGATPSGLELGPAHYRETALPGEGATVAVAGHRTTYLAPFRTLNVLAPGDRVVVAMPYGTFTYVVTATHITTPQAWWITRDVGYDQLVLSSCNPLYSASQRIVVFARLAGVTPSGPAQRLASNQVS